MPALIAIEAIIALAVGGGMVHSVIMERRAEQRAREIHAITTGTHTFTDEELATIAENQRRIREAGIEAPAGASEARFQPTAAFWIAIAAVLGGIALLGAGRKVEAK